MARDGVANVVEQLQSRGFDPRKVGPDSWEARCPVHRSTDHALAIGRNEHNHVVLECRSPQNCHYSRIIAALALPNDRVYAETPDWLINRLRRTQIQPASFGSGIDNVNDRTGASVVEEASDSSETPLAAEVEPTADGTLAALDCPPESDGHLAVVSATATSGEVPRESECCTRAESATCVALTSLEPAPAEAASSCGYAPADWVELFEPDPSATVAASEKTEPESTLQVLLRVAATARFFRAADGRLFAEMPVESRHEIHGLKSGVFRDWLIKAYFSERGEVPSQAVLRRGLHALEARARFEEGAPSVFVRLGREGTGSTSRYYLDLGDATGRAIEFGTEGWSVVDRPGVRFRRPEGLMSLPVPSRDGSIDLLRPYVNLGDRDFRLLIAWMAAALRPVGPYPILALYGEQAAAKSTLVRAIRLVIDPQEAPLLVLPRGTRNLMVTAYNAWLLAYDNISRISNSLSDGLCMMSTGGAYAGRALFSNDESSVIHVQRPVILSGIEEFVRRGDLSDRTVYLDLPSINEADRRREDQFWPAFHQDRPKILGGLLDAIVGGLRNLPMIDFPKLPRMADFAALGEAVGHSLGWPAGTLLADYEGNRREASAAQLEDSVVGTVLLGVADRLRGWSGSPTELLSALTLLAPKKVTHSAGWPKSAGWFTNELRRIAPQLRMHGISVAFARNSHGRFLSITTITKIAT